MTTATAQEVRKLVLPQPHAAQREVLLSPARYKISVWGRRAGKTLGALVGVTTGHGPMVDGAPMFKGLLQGAKIGWFAPTYPIASEAWRDAKLILGGVWADKSETERIISMPGGGMLQMISIDNPDAARGKGFDGAVLDEAAMYHEDTWPAAIRPTLSDRQGWAMFLTTPKGLNWLEMLYKAAGTLPSWARWQFPTSVNPTIPKSEIEDARRSLPDLIFRQEYMAEFVSGAGTVFRRETIRYCQVESTEGRTVYVLPAGNRRYSKDLCRHFVMFDGARTEKKQSDYTVASYFAITPENDLLLLEVVRDRIPPDAFEALVRGMNDKHTPGFLGFEPADWHTAPVQALIRQGFKCQRVPPEGTRQVDKLQRSEAAQVIARNGKLYLRAGASWVPEFESELCAFPMGRHDDQVDTLSMAANEVIEGRVTGNAQIPYTGPQTAAWVV